LRSFHLLPLAILAAATAASAFTVSTNQVLESGAALLSGDPSGDDIVPGYTPLSANSNQCEYLYDWSDRNGDKVREDPVSSPGLDLGVYSLRNQVNGIQQNIKLNLGGGDLRGTSGVTGIDFVHDLGTYGYPGASGFSAVNAGAIDMGAIDNHGGGLIWGRVGDVILGEPIGTGSGPAGPIRVDAIVSRNTAGYSSSGSVRMYGNGSVRIETSDGGAGDIHAGTYHGSGGSVLVRHEGALIARGIYTYTSANYGGASGAISLDGDAAGNGSLGACSISNLDASMKGTMYGGSAGAVSITNYARAFIGDSILTSSAQTTAGSNGGNISIAGIDGDIAIRGLIDAHASYSNAVAGALALQSTGGRIDLAALNLNLVRSAALSAPGKAYIAGALLGFDTGNPGNGKLDCPGGRAIVYDPTVPTNAYLGGLSYALKSGGRLAPPTPPGAVLVIR
jgi:hypothetical protein